MYWFPLIGVPPLAIAEILPELSPKQNKSLELKLTINESGLSIDIFNTEEHPLLSVTVPLSLLGMLLVD